MDKSMDLSVRVSEYSLRVTWPVEADRPSVEWEGVGNGSHYTFSSGPRTVRLWFEALAETPKWEWTDLSVNKGFGYSFKRPKVG